MISVLMVTSVCQMCMTSYKISQPNTRITLQHQMIPHHPFSHYRFSVILNTSDNRVSIFSTNRNKSCDGAPRRAVLKVTFFGCNKVGSVSED